MENKQFLYILLVLPVLFSCGEVSSSSMNPSVNSQTPTTITPTTEVPTTTPIDPLEELYNRVENCVLNDNYTLKYTLNGVEVIRRYTPKAYMNDQTNIGYAENEAGIFDYSLYKTNVVASEDYLRSDDGVPLKDLYNVQVTTVTSERVFTGNLVASLKNVNYAKIPSLKKSDNDLYNIHYNYVKRILPNDPDTDMYENVNSVKCKIGLTENGFKIVYTNQWSLEDKLTLEAYDIGTTKIEPIAKYMNEGKGPGDSGSLEDYSKVHKAISLIKGGNYKITHSDDENRYITNEYVLYEKKVEGGYYSYGYINIPEDNNLSLEKGCYGFEINDGVVTLTETEALLSNVYQSSLCFSPSVLNNFVENDDGTVETEEGYGLYTLSNYFSESIVEEGSYVKKATLDITYKDEKPSIIIECDVFNDNSQVSSKLTLTIDSFNETSVSVIDNYLESIK